MDHSQAFISYIKKRLDYFHSNKKDFHIIIVGTNDPLAKGEIKITKTIDCLLGICKKYNLVYQYYQQENEFIEAFLSGKIDSSKAVVYNRTTMGPPNSKRSLIPAFCGLNDIKCLGNDAYRMGLLCNKFHYSSILRNIGISVPDFWCYCSQYGWITTPPPEGIKVIAKLINENNKVSLTNASVDVFSENFNFLVESLSHKYNQPVIVQKFIAGYEITIPVFMDLESEVIVPQILGIYTAQQHRAGDQIMCEADLSYLRNTDCREKYYDFSNINSQVCENIRKDATLIAKALGIKGFSRFDVRIDDSYQPFFIDLGSMPGILPTCSFDYIFAEYGFTYEDFLITTMSMD